MEATNRIIKNTAFLYIKMFITVLASLYTTRVVLGALGTSDFGIFNLILGLVSMFMFFNSSLAQSSQRFMSYAKGKGDTEEEKTLFNISTILHFAVAIFLVLFLLTIKAYLFHNTLKIEPDRIDTAMSIYNFMIFGIFFMIISVPYDAVINANEHMLFVAILGIVESLLKLGIALIISEYKGDQLYLYSFLMSLILVITYIIKAIYSHSKYNEVVINFKKYIKKHTMKKMFSFTGFTFIGSSTQIFTNYGQGILLNMFFGTIVNAAQGIVSQVSGQIGAFAINMLKALNPMLIKSEGSGNRELMIKASYSGAKISFYLLMIFYIPIIIEMDTIFNIWLVKVPAYTLIFCKLLLVRNLIEQLYVTLGTSIMAVGKIKEFQIYKSFITLMPLPITYLFFSNGYAPSYLYQILIIYALIIGCVYIYYAKKICGMSAIEYFNEVILKSVIPFIIVFIISYIPHYLIENTVLKLFAVILTSFVFSFITIWIIGLNSYEKNFILAKINKFKR